MSDLSDLFGNPQALVPLVGQQIVDSTVSNMPEGIYSYGAFTLATAQQIAAATGTRSLQFLLNGQGSTPGTGVFAQIFVPYACTIANWVITADQPGSAVVDILRSTYAAFPTTVSIAGTDKPTLSSAQKNEDLTLTGWGSTAINAGDILQANLNSVSTVTQVFVTLGITVP